VARFFDATPNPERDRLALARIRYRIEALADRLEAETAWYPHRARALRRQRSILESCDLEGRPHKVVAVELGLEERQFYRERGRLRQRVAQWLAEVEDRSPAICVDRFSTQLAYLRALRNAGRNERVIAESPALLAQAEGEQRIAVANLLIEVYGECGEFARAQALLVPENAWGRAYVETLHGCDAAAAAEFLKLARVEPSGRSPDPSADEMQVRAALDFAQCAHTMGDHRAARHGWEMAADMLASQWLTPSTRLQTMWQVAAAAMMEGRSVDDAIAAFDHGLADAVRQVCPREASDILIARANAWIQKQALNLAVSDARNALDLARQVFGANAGAWRILNIARVELAAGNASEAIELVREAARAKGAHPMRDGYGEWIESSALLALGKIKDAVDVSAHAVEDLRASENRRYLGASLRIYAEAAARARRKREAVTAIEEAVELLTRFGLPRARANALRSRAQLLGASRRPLLASQRP
jgi:tetratricopeptide (TPR) repeat protein